MAKHSRKPKRQRHVAVQSVDNDAGSSENPKGNGFTFARILVAISVFAFLIRVIHVLFTVSVPTAAQLVGDAAGYYAWASEISGGNWYGDKTFYQAPLYPYFLAVLMKLGLDVTGMRLVQALLGAVGTAALGLAARSKFGERTGILTAALYGFYPAGIYYDGIIQKAALASALLCLMLAAIGQLQEKWKLHSALLAGLFLGLLVLTRENALLWIPLIGLWMVVATPNKSVKQRASLIAFYCAGLALSLLPVAARNASLGGEWSPTTFQAGPNFYIGNNLNSFGIYRPLVPGHETPMYERADAQAIAEATTGRELSAREVSRFWMNQSLSEIKQAPSRWLMLMVQKSFMVINRFEVPDVESIVVYRAQSVPMTLASIWNFGVLFPLAMLGLMCSLNQWRRLSLDYLLVSTMIAAIVFFFILGRYRFPLVPLLMPWAAFGVLELCRQVRERSLLANMKVPIVAAALAAILSNLPVHDESGLTASSIMNSGIAAAKNGNTDVAIRLLNESIQMEPGIAETHFNLGRAQLQLGRPAHAIRSFQIALKLDPNLSMVDLMLGQVYESIGEKQAALRHYQRAARISADSADAIQGITRIREEGIRKTPSDRATCPGGTVTFLRK